MKIYFAGQCPIDYETIYQYGVRNVLQSYFYVQKNFDFVSKMNGQCNLFLDSGAFSAWSKGVQINIDNYIDFIIKLNPPVYAGLDVIKDGEGTKKNIAYMQEFGLKPISTYHRGSDRKYLLEMLDNEEYIALGGMAGTGTSITQCLLWLDDIWTIILKRNSKIKVHGFACSGIKIMKYYPWHSVDSTSWLAPVIFGREIEDKSNNEILNEMRQEMPDALWDKKLERTVILEKSVAYFLKLENEINDAHETSNFERLNQLTLFD